MTTLVEQYSRAMIDGDHARCIQLEESHGLYGYPPEIVTEALAAIGEGKDPCAAIDKYLGAPS